MLYKLEHVYPEMESLFIFIEIFYNNILIDNSLCSIL